jgi:hypothetical protein
MKSFRQRYRSKFVARLSTWFRDGPAKIGAPLPASPHSVVGRGEIGVRENSYLKGRIRRVNCGQSERVGSHSAVVIGVVDTGVHDWGSNGGAFNPQFEGSIPKISGSSSEFVHFISDVHSAATVLAGYQES